jgi:hypothetical protein
VVPPPQNNITDLESPMPIEGCTQNIGICTHPWTS